MYAQAVVKTLLPMLLVWVWLTGCVAVQPFPIAARPGDTISVAVGSQDGMTTGNTRVWITSDADGNPIEITGNIRAIFNIYADKASVAYSPYGDVRTNFSYFHHEPWETVIALDLPLGLLPGPATVQVQTTLPQPTPLENGGNGAPYPNVNDVAIRLEILNSSGASNPFKYMTTYGGKLDGNLARLEPARQALIRPPIADLAGNWPTFGAIEFKISMPMQEVYGTLGESSIRMVVQDVTMFTGSKLQTLWGYDGIQLTVMFVSPSGNLHVYEPRFSVMAETADFTAVPTITSVRYFDINGATVAGPGISDYSVELLGSFY